MNQHPDYVLNKINGPKDLKKLSFEELSKLPDEMRQLVLEKDAAIGGHVGPNLGIMEVTTAFHYVFDAPKDKIVFDVSHQSYGHKMLTGRKNAFLDPDCYNDVTGYTNPDESEYDCFDTGHSSTSISAALGMCKSALAYPSPRHSCFPRRSRFAAGPSATCATRSGSIA